MSFLSSGTIWKVEEEADEDVEDAEERPKKEIIPAGIELIELMETALGLGRSDVMLKEEEEVRLKRSSTGRVEIWWGNGEEWWRGKVKKRGDKQRRRVALQTAACEWEASLNITRQ